MKMLDAGYRILDARCWGLTDLTKKTPAIVGSGYEVGFDLL